MLRLKLFTNVMKTQVKNFSIGYPVYASEVPVKEESERMKKFHEQLKLEPIPRVGPTMRFVDLVLVDVDPKNGELIPNSDKNPTKYGDWQHNGRVTDF